MKNRKTLPVKMTVFSALFTALIILGSYIAIPIGPVPITLQTFFILLAALLLGSGWGSLSVVVYLILGFTGLPVFSQGRAGYAHLFGPGGGFLFSFIFATWCAGFISEKGKHSIFKDCIAILTATAIIYVVGVPWYMFWARVTLEKAFLAVMLPFLPGDAIKAVSALVVVRFIKPIMKEFVQTQGVDAQD